jgi:hypothetical protein
MRFVLLALIAALLPQEKPTWPQIVELGQKNLERERELKSAIPRDAFDPAALARVMGGDPARAAEFVRTRIALEPVRGFVKGAQGALVSQRAGWADRALLLATLVADKSPRLVKGSLAAGKQPAGVVTAAPEALNDALIAEVAARLKTDPKRLEKKEKESEAAAAAFHDQAWARIRRDLEGVAAALQSAGVKPPGSVAAAPDEVWWVRIGDKDFGRPEGAEEKSVVPLAELPAGEIHRLNVRMKIQQGETETVVLDVSFRTMDLFGRVLTLSNVAGENPRKLTGLKGAKPKDYLDALAATGVFVPLLSGPGKPVSGHPFDLTGSKVTVKNGSILKLEGALDVFGRLPGGEEKKKELTGATLEVVRTEPGAEPVTARREILKKGVKGRQRVFDLLSIREILVLPGELRGDFSLDLLLQADIAVKEATLKRIQPNALAVEKRPARLNAKLYQFTLVRSAALRELSANLKAPLAAGTTLVSFVSRIVDGKPAKIRAGFDLLSNPSTNLAAPADWKENAAFAAGIVDTALEHEVHRVKGAHANTSVQLDLAVAAKSALQVETGGGRLRVVVPGKPGSWYEIDPRTGGCLGYVDEGGGQDMAEYATLLADTLEEIREWQSLADRINSVLECAMNALDAADAEASFAHCMAGVAIGEAFGWAAGGIIGGAAGDNPFARLGGMALEDALNDAFGAAMDGAMGGH